MRFLSTLLVPLAAASPAGAEFLAIRVGRAETVSHGVLEHAVILVEDGKIVMLGEDLPVEAGVPVVDLPNWTVTPGFVSCYTRIGVDSSGGDDFNPQQKARDELLPGVREMKKVVEYGVTTLGIYPAGNGIPGQSVAIRPIGDDVASMVLADPAYLKVIFSADAASKKRVRDGFKKAADHEDKVAKAKEKWDKDQEKKKSSKKEEKKDASSEEEKKDEGKSGSDAKGDKFVPPQADPRTQAFLDLRAGKLHALVSIGEAAEYLHWLDALGKETITWDLRLVLQPESDLHYVFDKKTYDLDVDGIGDRKLRTVIEPALTVTENTRRLRNLPAELARAGARVCFTPRDDSLGGYELWRNHVAELVAAGLDRDTALRALTLEPAGLLGLDKRLGSIEKGKDANLVFFDGDPLQTGVRVMAVMLDGRVVHGEVRP